MNNNSALYTVESL